ncbi:MAG: hypothetical protein IT304_13180, partial [Dehalococcoidia bacterium]|nr:hypothetical protein [Dehalococcoidia bacterium]
GIASARYEFISFIDDDNWVAPDWVENVHRVFEQHPDAAALNGHNSASVDGPLPGWFDRFSVAYAVTPADWPGGDVTDTRGWLWGAGLSLRRTAWNQITDAGWYWRLTGRQGLSLTCGEDSELTIALRLAGWRLRFEPSLRLRHRLDPHRLHWTYLRRMMRSMGEASVFHDLYAPHSGRAWWLPAAHSMKTAVGASLAGAALLSSTGSWRVLSMDRELGRIAALRRLRHTYAGLAAEVQLVCDRLRALRPAALVSR